MEVRSSKRDIVAVGKRWSNRPVSTGLALLSPELSKHAVLEVHAEQVGPKRMLQGTFPFS
jgi:hypothetical protein